MDAKGLHVAEKFSASRKLGRDEAARLLEGASQLIVAKGKAVNTWKLGARPEQAAIDAMLGPTGNLRAPTVKFGKTIIVGFNEAVYEDVLG